MRELAVGTCDLLRFYTDRKRFSNLDVYGVAVIAALLMHVNTSGRGAPTYHARPSQQTLASYARVTEPTVRKWIKYFSKKGFLVVRKRRAGKRNAPNEYDVTPAAKWIADGKFSTKPILSLIGRGRHDT